jgi:hypothetical protein
MGINTKTDRLTDRQLQHDFDFDFESAVTLTWLRVSMWEVPTNVTIGQISFGGSRNICATCPSDILHC